MQKDTNITDVIFRYDLSKGFEGTIFAMMPHVDVSRNHTVTSYQHIGQHSQADYLGCIQSSRPATSDEYAVLKREMENLGYNIRVIQKRNKEKYFASYRESWA